MAISLTDFVPSTSVTDCSKLIAKAGSLAPPDQRTKTQHVSFNAEHPVARATNAEVVRTV